MDFCAQPARFSPWAKSGGWKKIFEILAVDSNKEYRLCCAESMIE
jgi:hypothetical protein